jgi:hypothetical protein
MDFLFTAGRQTGRVFPDSTTLFAKCQAIDIAKFILSGHYHSGNDKSRRSGARGVRFSRRYLSSE